MPSILEIRKEEKRDLSNLLQIKKENPGYEVKGLQRKITEQIAVMEQEDIAHVEKIIGIKAID